MRLLACIFCACLLAVHAYADDASDKLNAHDFTFTSITGEPLPLSSYKGKVVLLVNTASECGFTGQYGGLQSLYETYKDKGLVVIGAPSNDFGGQEPGEEAEIKEFCETKYRVTFPLTEKVVVAGDAPHPFYAAARDTMGWAAAPKWNFHKYIIAPDGRVVDWFSSWVEPTSERITSSIEAHLPK